MSISCLLNSRHHVIFLDPILPIQNPKQDPELEEMYICRISNQRRTVIRKYDEMVLRLECLPCIWVDPCHPVFLIWVEGTKAVGHYTNKRKMIGRWLMRTCMLSHFSRVWHCGTLWTVAQAPLSMGFSRQEYWSGFPCPSPGDLPDLGIKSESLPLAVGFFFLVVPGKLRGAFIHLPKFYSFSLV